jgi:hypothetical protein
MFLHFCSLLICTHSPPPPLFLCFPARLAFRFALFNCLICVVLIYALFPFFHWLSFASVSWANLPPFLSPFSILICTLQSFFGKEDHHFSQTFRLRFLCSLFNTDSSAALRFHIVSKDAGIESRTVATLALALRCSNHSAKYHPGDCTGDVARDSKLY